MNQIFKASELSALTVAVIIPFYNGSAWVERAIKSVMGQTVRPDEFIIVNDGSKAEESEALRALSKNYQFTIINKENGGQGSARNAGVNACKSEFISFLDQDDYYFPDHIRDLVEALPEGDSRLGFIYADLCSADGAGNITHSNLLSTVPGGNPKRGHISALLAANLFILPSASLIKKSAFLSIGGFDEQFTGYEDDDLFLRMFRAGFTNHFLDRPVTVWCQHTGSTSYSIKMSRSRWRYFNKLREAFPDNEDAGIFYFRDYILPRFGPTFIHDAVRAKYGKRNSKDLNELIGIVSQLSKIVSKTPGISRSYKIKLSLFVLALTNLPNPLLSAFRAVGRLRIMRRNRGYHQLAISASPASATGQPPRR